MHLGIPQLIPFGAQCAARTGHTGSTPGIPAPHSGTDMRSASLDAARLLMQRHLA